jgi:hypothetical protein
MPLLQLEEDGGVDLAAPMPELARESTSPFPNVFAVLAAGFAFVVPYVAKRTMRKKPKVVSVVAGEPAPLVLAGMPKGTRASGPPRMSANWDDEDEERLFREMAGRNNGNNVMRGPAEAVLRNKPMAYVVIFNQGMPNEGVYTLSTGVGGSRTHILTFDNAEDADRFAHQLQGENFNVLGGERSVSLDAKPLMWDARRIAEFCHRSDFEVALVPAGGMIRPPESNTYDPAQFGRPNANETYEERLQRRRMMGQKERGPSAFNPIRGSDERRRAQDVLRNLNMTRNQKRGQSVWASAMRNAGHSFNDVGEEMCGIEECGLDSFPEERDSLERIVLDDLRDDGPMGP